MASAAHLASNLNIAQIAPAMLPDAWRGVRRFVQTACDGSSGKYLPADIIKLVASGHMQLWASYTDEGPVAVVLTEICNFPQKRVCRLLACTGEDYPAWLGFLDVIEDWARGEGCAAMEPIARPGWKRVLKGRGYVETHSLLEKAL